MTVISAGEQIVATGVTFEEYLAQYAGDFCEYIEGTVSKMNPVSLRHDSLVFYVRVLLEIYFVHKPIGRVVGAPVAMSLSTSARGREPDLQVILSEHIDRISLTYVDGPADICIEVVSPES